MNTPYIDTPYIETDCTIKHQGHSLSAGGAVVTNDRLIAYPAKGGILNDWHGNAIGTWKTISTRPAIFFGYRSHLGSDYYYMRAVVNGRAYSLRGFGPGNVAMGRALKTT